MNTFLLINPFNFARKASNSTGLFVWRNFHSVAEPPSPLVPCFDCPLFALPCSALELDQAKPSSPFEDVTSLIN